MKNVGFYNKYTVIRNDGKSAVGEKHHNCVYFVLDMSCDEYARPALKAYAEACADKHPELAKDLLSYVNGTEV